MSVLLTFVFATFATASPFQNGQRKVDPKAAPNAAAIYYDGHKRSDCSATLIDEQTALTSSHCVLAYVSIMSGAKFSSVSEMKTFEKTVVSAKSKDFAIDENVFNRYYKLLDGGFPKVPGEMPRDALKGSALLGVSKDVDIRVWVKTSDGPEQKRLPYKRRYYYPKDDSKFVVKAGGVEFGVKESIPSLGLLNAKSNKEFSSGDYAILKLSKSSKGKWSGQVLTVPNKVQCNALNKSRNSVVKMESRGVFTKSDWQETIDGLASFPIMYGYISEIADDMFKFALAIKNIPPDLQKLISGETVQVYQKVGVTVRLVVSALREMLSKIPFKKADVRKSFEQDLVKLEKKLNYYGSMVGQTVFDPFDFSKVNLNSEFFVTNEFVGNPFPGDSGHGLVLDASKGKIKSKVKSSPMIFGIFSEKLPGTVIDAVWSEIMDLRMQKDRRSDRQALYVYRKNRESGRIGKYKQVLRPNAYSNLCSDQAQAFLKENGVQVGPRKAPGVKSNKG